MGFSQFRPSPADAEAGCRRKCMSSILRLVRSQSHSAEWAESLIVIATRPRIPEIDSIRARSSPAMNYRGRGAAPSFDATSAMDRGVLVAGRDHPRGATYVAPHPRAHVPQSPAVTRRACLDVYRHQQSHSTDTVDAQRGGPPSPAAHHQHHIIVHFRLSNLSSQ